ncbi:MAG: hypothetical protein MAG581_00293 [Deltaproteobacteria bacterium]|jgi:hypothetical protein|nr:hypothetical protein [Deltaproteobacteria bacterium]
MQMYVCSLLNEGFFQTVLETAGIFWKNHGRETVVIPFSLDNH